MADDDDCPTLILSTRDLRVVRDELFDLRRKWYDIGIGLEVNRGILDKIRREYGDDNVTALREMLTEWLRFFGAKWEDIVTVLKYPEIGEEALAGTLEKKYCYPPPAPGAQPKDKPRIMTKSDIDVIVDCLTDNASKWREIGMELGFCSRELQDIISTEAIGPIGCLKEMLDEWETWRPGKLHGYHPTDHALFKALKEVKLGPVALKIKEALKKKAERDKERAKEAENRKTISSRI